MTTNIPILAVLFYVPLLPSRCSKNASTFISNLQKSLCYYSFSLFLSSGLNRHYIAISKHHAHFTFSRPQAIKVFLKPRNTINEAIRNNSLGP